MTSCLASGKLKAQTFTIFVPLPCLRNKIQMDLQYFRIRPKQMKKKSLPHTILLSCKKITQTFILGMII